MSSMITVESIDVDAPLHIDLTKDNLIDLTGIDDSSPTSTEHSPASASGGFSFPILPEISQPQKGQSRVIPTLQSSKSPAFSSRDSPREPMELLDSEESEEEMRLWNPKKSRLSYDESSYDHIHAAYDINDPSLWQPIKFNESKIDFQLLNSPCILPNEPAVDTYYGPDISSNQRCNDFPAWAETLSKLGSLRFRRPPLSQGLSPTMNTPGRVPFRSFRHVTSFKSAPGSIVRIVQSESWAAICSSATGGHPDEPDSTVDQYNREGAVMVWNGKLQPLAGHIQPHGDSVKQYSVNDIKFAPSRDVLVTTGNDLQLNSWRCDLDTGIFSPWLNWKFSHVPRDLAFQPGGESLAVAERKVYVYSTIQKETATEVNFVIAPARKKHSVGALTWGREGSSSFIYASSEPDDESEHCGVHKAFDIREARFAYDFDEKGAGDAIAITADGTRLALVTRHSGRSHSLQIYSLRNNDSKAKLSTFLLDFPKKIVGEVNCAAFSSDGIYLALGRNDNHTHIYDSRMLSKVLFDYGHSRKSRTHPGHHSFGIIQLEWVEGGVLPTGIVTGGSDGCVRYWNPFQSACNGTVIAETSSDVAAFSLGDYYVGERALVVGDCAGEVSIFDP